MKLYIGAQFRILFLAISLICSSCNFGGSDTVEIIVVSTNDIHAAFEQMPKVVTVVKDLKAQYDNVLILDAGDHCTGNPYVDMADPQGAPINTLMSMVGYDYGAVGNHEFDYRQSGYLCGIEASALTPLCANADFEGTILEDYIKPYEIFEIGGVRAAILGLIQIEDSGLPSAMPDNMKGIDFVNGVDKSLEFKFLRDSADLVIALTHLGFEDDSLMVCKNTMFDLVVGGHTHTYLPEGRLINGTLVTQTGSKLKGVGISKITMKGDDVISVTNHVLSLEGVESDADALAYVESCKADSPLNEPIGEVDRTLSRVGLMNMVTDIMRERSGADIVLQNAGSIRIDSLVKGGVKIASIYELEPFRNHIVTQELTLAQIKEMIMIKFNSSGGESRTVDLSASGMTYNICVGEDGKATDVECFDQKGNKMVEKSYIMGTSNYVASAYTYAGKGKATPIENRVVIADAVIDVIKRDGVYVGDNDIRVFIKGKE
ncbi:MAG: bifunctional UDP-sugar hydrolase/5'-nucleotidase [Rikenellaceae bacterium]